MSPLLRLLDFYGRRRYTILFYSLLFSIGFTGVLAALKQDLTGARMFLGFNLVPAIVATNQRRQIVLALLVFVGAFGIQLAALAFKQPQLDAAALALWGMIGLVAGAGALRHALRAKRVDGEHVYGALSAYLIAGIFLGLLYFATDRFWPGSFVENGRVLAETEFRVYKAVYFSFVTLSTVGYGDIVPINHIVRGLAIFEAIAGQLYLAVMVARLVSLYSVRD
jgi:hypothetical protein